MGIFFELLKGESGKVSGYLNCILCLCSFRIVNVYRKLWSLEFCKYFGKEVVGMMGFIKYVLFGSFCIR